LAQPACVFVNMRSLAEKFTKQPAGAVNLIWSAGARHQWDILETRRYRHREVLFRLAMAVSRRVVQGT
jgi:hypothetical protein